MLPCSDPESLGSVYGDSPRPFLGFTSSREQALRGAGRAPSPKRLPKAGGKEVGDGDAEGAGDTIVPGLPVVEPGDAHSTPGDS